MTTDQYLANINQRFKLGNATEHTFRGDLQQLLESLIPGVVTTNEPKRRSCGAPDYIDNMAGNFELSSSGSGSTSSSSGEDDELYNEAVGFIMETRKVSASSIQRKFSIGYNRAARIVDSMEDAGLVSAMGKSGKRELLM